jgi:hypothetical protein
LIVIVELDQSLLDMITARFSIDRSASVVFEHVSSIVLAKVSGLAYESQHQWICNTGRHGELLSASVDRIETTHFPTSGTTCFTFFVAGWLWHEENRW